MSIFLERLKKEFFHSKIKKITFVVFKNTQKIKKCCILLNANNSLMKCIMFKKLKKALLGLKNKALISYKKKSFTNFIKNPLYQNSNNYINYSNTIKKTTYKVFYLNFDTIRTNKLKKALENLLKKDNI